MLRLTWKMMRLERIQALPRGPTTLEDSAFSGPARSKWDVPLGYRVRLTRFPSVSKRTEQRCFDNGENPQEIFLTSGMRNCRVTYYA